MLSHWLKRLRPAALAIDRAGRSAVAWVRAPVRHRDLELSARARRWLDKLPAEARPTTLAERYPRIVNRLATTWDDTGITAHLLEELMIDRRGDRQGFPETVAGEIAALYGWLDLRRQAVDVDLD